MTKQQSVALHAEEKPARLLLGIGSAINDNTIARVKRGEHLLHFDPVGPGPCDFSCQGAPLLAETGVNELLMIHSMKPT